MKSNLKYTVDLNSILAKTSMSLLALMSTLMGVTQNDFTAVGDKSRVITRSSKLSDLPKSRDTTIQIPEVKYYIEPKSVTIKFDIEPIEPAKLKVVEPLEKLYHGYVKGGIGMYAMPYMDAYYNSTRSKKNTWGVNYKHHSALDGINDIGSSKFSENYLDGYYKHFLKRHTLATKLYYHRDILNYYGFSTLDTLIPETYRLNPDTLRQGYHNIGFNVTLASNYADTNKLNHVEHFNYHYLYGIKKLSEHNFEVGTTLNKYLPGEGINALVTFGVDINTINQPNLTPIDTVGVVLPEPNTLYQTTGIIRLVPHVIRSKGKVLFKGGFGVNIDIADENRFFFFPEVELSANLFNNVFVPYAGATGGVKRNSYNSMRLENPFLLNNIPLRNSADRINAYAGIRGGISARWTFNTSFRFQNVDAMPLFVNDTAYSYQNAFTVIYDNVKRMTVTGQLGFQANHKFTLFAKGEYFINKTENQEFAWLMPNFNVSLNGIYDLADKIVVRANIYVIGQRKTFSYFAKDDLVANTKGQYVYTLKPYVDANLGIEYRYNKRLSAFLNLNNIATVKYQKWTNFPVQSFNLMGGFTFSF
jgi:hypothetical protein